MTTEHRSRRSSTGPAQRISGPGELLQAVPYLLGFHPRNSLVLVGLDAGVLIVTVRLDLADAEVAGVLQNAIQAMHLGGSTSIVGAIYDDAAAPGPTVSLPWSAIAASVDREAAQVGCDVMDVLLVAGERWWSFTCVVPECCPPDGRLLPDGPSAFTTAATYAGVVALPDRESLEAVLEPLPHTQRDLLLPALAAAENAAVAEVLDGHGRRHDRSVKRALFAAARASDEPCSSSVPDDDVARFGAALSEIAMRDALWMAVDDGRLDGRGLWRELARQLPSPYDAAPLFLFGWAAWRSGDGALAGIAAQRAVDSDSGYSAADLLLAALARGVDPRRLPKLRLPRSA
jgi:hypothetical protein